MSEDEHRDLADRIKRAQDARAPKKTEHDKQAESAVNAGGLALRYGAEFGASVFVGLMLGLLIDNLFNSAPWGLLIMLGFGLAAGVLGVIRAYKQINADMAARADQQDYE